MSENKIQTLVISPYSREQRFENGLISFATAKKDDGVGLVKILRWWHSTPDNDKQFCDYLLYPLLPMRFHSRLPLAYLQPMGEEVRSTRQTDAIIIDSDPFIVASFKSIIRQTRPRKVVYRVSDPIYLRTSNQALIRAELKLFAASDEIWCPNDIIKNELEGRYGSKAVTIRNPIKQIGQEEIQREAPGVSQRAHEIKSSYKRIGIFFGKIDIDFNYLAELALANPDYAFVIFGNYKCDICPSNVYFEGFQSLARILAFMRHSAFFFDLASSDFGVVEYVGITAKVLSAVETGLPYLISTRREELLSVGAILLPPSAREARLDNLLSDSSPLNVDLPDFEEERFLRKCDEQIRKLFTRAE